MVRKSASRIHGIKAVEFQQRAENGGWPAPNECGFFHGELVYIVRKRELEYLLDRVDALYQQESDRRGAKS
jgi:hypothetical protein